MMVCWRNVKGEDLEDFPLDTNEENEANQEENFPDDDGDPAPSTEKRMQLLNEIMAAALKRPSSKERLSQVLPIIRSMSPPQRLALVGLVMQRVNGNGKSTQIGNYTDAQSAELLLPISADIAAIFDATDREEGGRGFGTYYNPFMALRRYPAYPSPPRGTMYSAMLPNRRIFAPRLRDEIPPEMKPPPLGGNPDVYASFDEKHPQVPSSEDECDGDLCLDVKYYPTEEIGNSIDDFDHRGIFRALFDETHRNFQAITPEADRRQDVESEGSLHLCPSKVKFARPKRAKTTSGLWKFVVNTEQYTQTVRMENCLTKDEPCSHVSESVKSYCSQVYNYHRLLTWDNSSGLTLDIFKIPTCCSCQIQSIVPFVVKNNKKLAKPGQYHNDNIILDDSNSFQVVPNAKQQTPQKPRKPILPQRSNPKRESASNRPRSHLKPRPIAKYTIIDSEFRRSQNHKAFEEEEKLESTPPSSRRINYSYHPILDFIQSTRPRAEDRSDDVDIDGSWKPVAEGPRAAPKK